MIKRGNKTFTIAIEGNIGSGKSTLLESLKSNKLVTVLPEPIHKWRNLNGTNLFQLMVEEPKRWANVFQNYVVKTLLDHHVARVDTPIKIMERSIFSAKHCFMNVLLENGIVHPVEAQILEEWVTFLKEHTPIDVDMGIYIRTDPEVSLQRTLNRGRMEESAITLTYLTQLHNKHEEWLLGNKWRETFRNIRIIDGNSKPEEIVSQYKAIEREINLEGEINC